MDKVQEENINLSPEELNMLVPNTQLKEDLDPSKSYQQLEITSRYDDESKDVLVSYSSGEAKYFLDELLKNPSVLTETFTYTETIITNDSISVIFTSLDEYTTSQANNELYNLVNESLEGDVKIEDYDGDATWNINMAPQPKSAINIEQNFAEYPTIISHFIQLSNTDSKEIRYMSIGINEKKGFNGSVIDYVGGGEYDQFHYINGKLLINQDDSTEDEFQEHFARIYGSKKMIELNELDSQFIEWNDNSVPITKLGLDEFTGRVNIKNFPATPDVANTTFTDDVRGEILASTLQNPFELEKSIILTDYDDALTSIVEQVYIDYISSPDFSFQQFVDEAINPVFVYGPNQFLDMQEFIKSNRESLELNDDSLSYGYQRYYAINDEAELIFLGLFNDSDKAINSHNDGTALIFGLNESEAQAFIDSAEYFIDNDTSATLDNNGTLYPDHEVSENDRAIYFTKQQLAVSANVFYTATGSDKQQTNSKPVKKSKARARGQ